MTTLATEREQLPAPEVTDLGRGVYGYMQPDGTWGLNNTGFLAGRDGVLVIDTCFTEARTRAFLDAIRGVTDKPLRTLANTHHHGDHTHGNYLLPAATIVGHELCRQTMIATGHGTTGLFPGVEWGDIEIAPPFVTFTDRLNLYVDDLCVEALHVGTPAHTTNDVVYLVGEERLLFAGDLAFKGGTPFVLMGSVEGSLQALDVVQALDVDRVVPGHGPVCGMEVFDDMRAYYEFVLDLSRRAVDDGTPALEAARAADLGRFAEWDDRERLVGNLHRAMAELQGAERGAVLDLEPIVADIVEYNDGQPLRCLA